jgi:hypothetical protein
MRPLRGTYRGGIAELDVPALMQDIGIVCSLCERPLNDFATLWDTDYRLTVGPTAPATESNALLVICADCSEADAARGPQPDEELSLPNRDTTFSLSGDSAFRYSLDEVRVIILDSEWNEERSTVHTLAIVHGTNPAAENTIARFALNTRYYDPENTWMRIPEQDVLCLTDRRVEERTRVWLRASELVEDLEPDAVRDGRLMHTLREVADMAGFWSVWMTLLGEKFSEEELLESAFSTGGMRIRGTLIQELY